MSYLNEKKRDILTPLVKAHYPFPRRELLGVVAQLMPEA